MRRPNESQGEEAEKRRRRGGEEAEKRQRIVREAEYLRHSCLNRNTETKPIYMLNVHAKCTC